MDPRSLRVTQNAYFPFVTHRKLLSVLMLCFPTARIDVSFWTHQCGKKTKRWNDRKTDGQMERQTWRLK